MKKLLLLSLLLVGCREVVYRVYICPKGGVGCTAGSSTFDTSKDCEEFAKKATLLQPEAPRICAKQHSF